ncbi:MAG: OmpA family protein [Phycisphaeraceae bacterium]|nr:OmpA family protein [Phycisphaeraceae bacterium]
MDRARMLVYALALVMGFGALTGCTNQRLKEERDALWAENQELNDELTRTRQALDAAQAELANRPMAVAPSTAPTGFEGIAGVDVSRTAGTISVRVPGDVLFASGKVDLKGDSLSTLNQIVSVLNSQYAGSTIRVAGYTDTDPIKRSGWKDNLELSLQRAAAVHRQLQKVGIAPERMYAAGYGEWHPRESKAQSRRVEIVVVLQE